MYKDRAFSPLSLPAAVAQTSYVYEHLTSNGIEVISWDPYARVQSEEESNQDSINLQDFLKKIKFHLKYFKQADIYLQYLKKVYFRF